MSTVRLLLALVSATVLLCCESSPFTDVDATSTPPADSGPTDGQPADTLAPDLVPHPSGPIKVASFNLQVFGQAKAGRSAVLSTLTRIIRSYDIVALQEIADASAQAPGRLLEVVNAAPGPTYDMLLSQRSGLQPDDETYREQYAFFYNVQTVAPLGRASLFDDQATDFFQREPYVARFGSGTLDLVLINLHTVPRRATAEFGALDRVFAWAKQQHPQSPTVVALGDFNAGCTYASAEELDALPIGGPDYTWIVPHDADTNLADSHCAYDRILATAAAESRWTGQWGVDRSFDSSEISDHYPVWASFHTE